MGTTYEHTQLAAVQENGDVNVIYPINTAKDVSVESKNSSIPSSVKNMEDLVNSMKDMAFNNGNNMVYLGSSTVAPEASSMSEIDDEKTSTTSTWSSVAIEKNTNNFIQGYRMTVDNINKLFVNPTVFNVDGRYDMYNKEAPEPGRQWIVEYFPLTLSKTNETGDVGDLNTVTTAMQRWTGLNFSDDKEMNDIVVFERAFINGSWKPFINVR